jgi:hypothetical protein
MVKLGQKVRDRITGFTGVVTGRVEYITGCNQLLIAPAVGADGSHKESVWIDEQRVFVVDPWPIVLDNGSTPGFDVPAPRR